MTYLRVLGGEGGRAGRAAGARGEPYGPRAPGVGVLCDVRQQARIGSAPAMDA
jgi:hypothetical protein